jgi:periplasmic copper chaperone A
MERTILLAALLLGACAKAPEGEPDIKVQDAWARETVAGQTGTAAYMTIANVGKGADRLLSISAAPPVTAMIHQTSNEGGVSKMRPIEDGLPVPAGQAVKLTPGGTHVMIMGLTAPLKRGDTLKLKLEFERSGQKAVDATVAGAEGR